MERMQDLDPVETGEWVNSLRAVLHHEGSVRATYLLEMLAEEARRAGIVQPSTLNTPYVNTIPPEREERADWDRDIEHRIRSIIRWNAVAIILRANKKSSELGGHIASFQSAATLYDMASGVSGTRRRPMTGATQVYTGHRSGGIYARAFVEGRSAGRSGFSTGASGHGLSSYPHPWLMPDFWQFPPYRWARADDGDLPGSIPEIFARRGIAIPPLARSGPSWATARWTSRNRSVPFRFGREQLDNLIFVVDCNLQRLDGPVAATARSSRNSKAFSRALAGTSSRCFGAPDGTSCSPRWVRHAAQAHEGVRRRGIQDFKSKIRRVRAPAVLWRVFRDPRS